MHIDDYAFGRITINGKTYNSDLKIINGKIFPNWWRKQGHYLQVKDIEDIFKARPHSLVIGTGAAGVMKIDKEVLDRASSMGMEVQSARSAEAVRLFNELSNKKGTEGLALAIHLTC